MAHNYEKVVALISKDPHERDDRKVDLLIPWFQNMSALFKAQKTDVVKDIVRNCDFLPVTTDTVIIKQGGKGDCFYIILSGSVSVYINQALEDQDNVAKSPPPRDRMRKSRPNTRLSTRPSSRVRSPEKTHQSQEHSSNSKIRLSAKNDHSSLSAKEAGRFDENTRKIQAEHNENQADGSDQISSDEIGGKADAGTANQIEIIIDDVSQADSGLSSERMLLDENDNDIYNKGNESNGEVEDDDDEDDYDDFDSDFDYSSDDDTNGILKPNTTKLERSLFGVHIRELEAGKCFGELALVQNNPIRTASIIANQQTNLIVINRELYNRCLKAAQQHEFNLKKNFVNTFPLFRNWTPRQRSVMTMSLTRYQYQYGNTMARQGSPVKGLHFILQGSAKVSTDTVQHITQYPNFCTETDVQFAKDVKTGRGTRTTHPGSSSWESGSTRRGVQHCVRRKETYAEAEKDMNYKNTDMCVIGAGDYIGDFEVLLRLPTYSFSVKCLQGVDTFELDLNNFERQIVKKSPTTYALLKETAETKLRARVKRLVRDQQIYMPVLEAMLNRLQMLNKPNGWKSKTKSKLDVASTSSIGSITIGCGDEIIGEYREKQRQFLRRRQREKRLEEKRNIQMAHAASLGLQLQMQNMTNMVNYDGIPDIEMSTIERKASDIFPDVPSNVKLRVDPITGLIRATEIRVPRNMVYQSKGSQSGVMNTNGQVVVPRSKRQLLNALENKDKANLDVTRDESKNGSLKDRRIRSQTFSPGIYQSAHLKTTSSSLTSLNGPSKSSGRPFSGKSSNSQQGLSHVHRPKSRSAGSQRTHSSSF
nr:uncharacterized protein LOC129256296 [Lytechinus pictus]